MFVKNTKADNYCLPDNADSKCFKKIRVCE